MIKKKSRKRVIRAHKIRTIEMESVRSLSLRDISLHPHKVEIGCQYLT